MDSSINIIKHSGDIVPFNVDKLKDSLRRAQASEEIIQQIVAQIESAIYNGITTKKIYQMAFKMLKGKSRVSASKYKLKKALMELGPSGFPFEKLVGKLLAHEGFEMLRFPCTSIHDFWMLKNNGNIKKVTKLNYIKEVYIPIHDLLRMQYSTANVLDCY